MSPMLKFALERLSFSPSHVDPKKMWYIYTVEYYTAVKNNDILKFADEWMDLEKTILSEVTQTQKGKYNMYLSISGF